MRTTASLAAFVTLMAVASSNGAPMGTPSGSSARSISRARGQLRSRNIPPIPSNFQDLDYTVDVPNVKCGDCRESEVKKVSVDATGPATSMEGDLNDMRAKLFSADVQVPGVPSGSGTIDIDVDEDPKDISANVQVPGVPSGTGSIDIDVDVDDSEDNNEASTRPEKHTNDDDANTSNNDANNSTSGGTNDDGKTDDGRTDNGQDGKADPPAEQPPCDNSNDIVEDVRDKLEEDNKVADDKASNVMAKAKSESDQAGDGAKAAFLSTSDGEMKSKAQQMADNMPDTNMGFHAEAKLDRQDDAGKSYKMPSGEGTTPELVAVSQEPSSENPEDCKDETTVEMRKGVPSVSTSVVRR
ncbi:hypothetical protein BDV93DRAFT_207408 [Ceratobasidium sp. AG-I]|nr:hypothetical protein BDV93DRAFT_207408 [Ceratobasidium sp. AG-I]